MSVSFSLDSEFFRPTKNLLESIKETLVENIVEKYLPGRHFDGERGKR